MRTPLMVGNWKMNRTGREAVDFVTALKAQLPDTGGVDVVLCPPFTALGDVGRALAGLSFELGAQDVHWEPHGAFTGEVSAAMLWDLGCTYVIVGHSERRRLLGESDDAVRRKVAAALGSELIPILCVGESLEERDDGRTERILQTQARIGTMDVTPEQAAQLVVAYEPVWAIGTGRNAEPSDAGQVIALIRQTIADLHDGDLAQGVRIQYGGSVKAGNIRDFMAHPEVDGALVGGASLDPEELALIVKYR